MAGLDIEVTSLRQAVGAISRLAGDGQVHHIVTVNVDQALNARDGDEVRQAFQSARFRFADGAPVVALAHLLGARLPGRVTGADILPAMCAYASRHALRVAIVGGAAGVPEEAAHRLQTKYPQLENVLGISPPMGFEEDPTEDDLLLQRLRNWAPDLVFVCLGSPRQELWVHRREADLPPAVYLGVGAAVDFAAGRLPRAPSHMQRLGLEWLHRLALDRRRLWRRYILRDPRFIKIIVEELWARRRHLGSSRI